MPNRILRDYTDSTAFDGLSAEAERLFVRLLMKADDFGRFHANPKLVKSACFPLAEDLRANTVAAWLTELSDRQLVFCYTSGTGEYLAIPRFRQRSRADKSKFPSPDGKPPDWHPPPDDGQVTVNGRSSAHVFGDGDGDVIEDDAQARKAERARLDSWIEKIREAYPRKGEQQDCRHAIRTALDAGHQTPEQILDDVLACAVWVKQAEEKGTCSFVPCAGAFFSKRQWTDPKKFEGIAIRVKEAQNGNKPKRRDSGDLNADDRYT